jgi:hypothetical protein
MILSRFRSRSASRRRTPAPPTPPRHWPVDPELSRQVTETRAGIERTRRQLARHVLPERKRGRKTPAAHGRPVSLGATSRD